jgi:hypothetical protein
MVVTSVVHVYGFRHILCVSVIGFGNVKSCANVSDYTFSPCKLVHICLIFLKIQKNYAKKVNIGANEKRIPKLS